MQRGNILLKQGSTEEAREDFQAVVNYTIPLFHIRSFNLPPLSPNCITLVCILSFLFHLSCLKVLSALLTCVFQLKRSPDNEEAHDQLHKINELELLQEEAQEAHHRGDYVTTVQVLERVIEVS